MEFTEPESKMLRRIAINPENCHGKPTVRGLRYPVESLLEYLSAGDTNEDILAEFPDLEKEDLHACILYATRSLKLKTSATCLLLTGFLMIVSAAFAGEVIIHDGPTISVPGAELVGPNRPGNYKPPEIRFTKQFFADEKTFSKNNYDPVTGKVRERKATEAITLALASVFSGDGSDGAKVTKLENLESKVIPDRTIRYFLITISVNGSEEHRIVLHDGSVIEPRLMRLDD